MPLRELRRRFTKSELVVAAWRSAEMAHYMRQTTKQTKAGMDSKLGIKKEALSEDVKRFINEDGDVDLRLMSGDQVYNYLAKQGLRLPVVSYPRKSKPS